MSCVCLKTIEKVLLLTSDVSQVAALSRNPMVLSSRPVVGPNLPRLLSTVVKYTYIKWSPVEIQTLTHWHQRGHVMTACVIAQQCSSAAFAYCAFTSARIERRFSKPLLFKLLFLFLKAA